MNRGWFRKGHKINLGKHWKLSDSDKNKLSLSKRNNKNPMWKDDKVSYSGLHRWIRRNFEKSDKCEKCSKDKLSSRKIHWANKSGNYLRDRSDWIRLCAKCHKSYDRKKS